VTKTVSMQARHHYRRRRRRISPGKEIHDLGATSSTFYVVQEVGAQGRRPRQAESANVKIEVICTVEVADKILPHVEKNYFPNYAMIAFVDDVEVARSG
jgi:nitrogen regulatory protein P-II 2